MKDFKVVVIGAGLMGGGIAQTCAQAGYEVLHALALGPRVVVAVALQKVDRAPHAEAGAQRHNEGLQNTDRAIEKCHRFVLLKVGGRSIRPALKWLFCCGNTGFSRSGPPDGCLSLSKWGQLHPRQAGGRKALCPCRQMARIREW